MTYQVLARKLRPRTFDEVIGQDHVTAPLRNAIKTGRVPHAILLTGPRGTGKTTLARILACCLNAEKGPTDSPAPDDPACMAIAAGNSIDVQEIDAASRTSVDDVRDLIDAVRYAPTPGKHRIYIVDEVHMLSTAAFNALLKTLEEPPPHSLFIFCTTNPEKIPFTVVSRCQRYDLRRIGSAQVAAHLAEAAQGEGIEISPTSLQAIARAGDGSMRDSLTLLDQLLAYGGGAIDDAQVAQVLDLIDSTIVRDILAACVDGDAPAALDGCAHAFEQAIDAKRLGEALLATLRDLVVLRVAPGHDALIDAVDAERDELIAIAERGEPARLRRMFRALMKEQEDLAWAPEPFAVLEMAVVRLATLPAGDDVARLLVRLDALEQTLRDGGGGPGDGGSAGAGGGASGGPKSGGARRGSASGSGSRRGSKASKADARAEQRAAPAPGRREAEARARHETEPPAARSKRAIDDEPPPPGDGDAPPDAPPLHAVPNQPEARPLHAVPNQPETLSLHAVPDRSESAPEAGEPAQDSRDAAPAPPEDAPASGATPELVFDRLKAFARERDRAGFASLDEGRIVEQTENSLRIAFASAIATRRMERRIDALETLCRDFFDRPMRVEIEPHRDARAPAPRSKRPAARKASAPVLARQSALEHPSVNLALELLDAEILEIRSLRGDDAGPSDGAPS